MDVTECMHAYMDVMECVHACMHACMRACMQGVACRSAGGVPGGYAYPTAPPMPSPDAGQVSWQLAQGGMLL
eukprot:357048-Chlamydomonas_euryale.AAC.4